jgi:hypothetical protein
LVLPGTASRLNDVTSRSDGPAPSETLAGAVIVHLAKQLGAAAEQYLQYDWTAPDDR